MYLKRITNKSEIVIGKQYLTSSEDGEKWFFNYDPTSTWACPLYEVLVFEIPTPNELAAQEAKKAILATLSRRRAAKADEAFADADFGDEEVKDSNGWIYTSPGREYTKSVYFENGDEDSYVETFVVLFKDNESDEIEEAYLSGD